MPHVIFPPDSLYKAPVVEDAAPAFDEAKYRNTWNTPWNAINDDILRQNWLAGVRSQVISRELTKANGYSISTKSIRNRARFLGLAARNFDWEAEQAERLTALFNMGASYGHIAKTLNAEFGEGYTRSAIAGKCSRIGLKRRVPLTPAMLEERRRQRREYNLQYQRKRAEQKAVLRMTRTSSFGFGLRAKIVGVWIEPICDDEIPVEQRKTFMELTKTTCRHPVGEVGEEGFFFCGATVETDKPYCPAHCARNFRAPEQRGVRRDVNQNMMSHL